jgi:hypothetical protein
MAGQQAHWHPALGTGPESRASEQGVMCAGSLSHYTWVKQELMPAAASATLLSCNFDTARK